MTALLISLLYNAIVDYLQIENAVRDDSGKFTIALKNPSGQAESTATVTVVGKPAPPQGPLDVTDICADGGVLHWGKPLDDGGEPIQGGGSIRVAHYQLLTVELQTT